MPSLPLACARVSPSGREYGGDPTYRSREDDPFSRGEKAEMRVSTVCKERRNGHERAWRDEPAGLTI